MRQVLSQNLSSRLTCYLNANFAYFLQVTKANETLCRCYSKHYFTSLSLRSNVTKSVASIPPIGSQHSFVRKYSNEKSSKLPKLMDVEPIVGINPWYLIRNYINTYLIIRPYFDEEFTIPTFLEGAKHALIHVSSQLARNDMDELEGIVDEKAISEIKKNIKLFTPTEREKLEIKMDDIMKCYAYNIGIIMNDEKRFVEITVVYWCTDARRKFEIVERYLKDKKLNFHDSTEAMAEEITICNFRFIREYTKGVNSGWIVNQLNFFNLAALADSL